MVGRLGSEALCFPSPGPLTPGQNWWSFLRRIFSGMFGVKVQELSFFSDEFRFLQNSRFCQVMEVDCCLRVPLLRLPALARTLLTPRHTVTNCQEESQLDTVPLSAERLRSNSGKFLTSAARPDLSTSAILQPHQRATLSASARWCFGSVLVWVVAI